MITPPSIDGGVRQWRRYPALKRTDVPWLDEIPSSWKPMRLKFVVSKIGSGKTPRGGGEVYLESGVVFLRSQNVHFEGLRLDDVVHIDEETDREMSSTRVHPKDVLLNITGASLGRCALVGDSIPTANVNQHVCILRPRLSLIEPGFLNACIASRTVQAQIFSSENGVSREGLNYTQTSNLYFALPSTLHEQRSIVAFLDRETAKIDALIAKKEQLIELLQEKRTALISHAVTKGLDPTVPVKDSGIDWVGKMPVHWTAKRAKFLFRQANLPVREGDGVVTAFRDGQVTLRENRRTEGYTFAVLEVGYQGIRKGQLVLHSMDAFAGAIGVSESDGKCSPEYIVCDPLNQDTIPEFYASCLREMSRQGFIEVSCKAVRERAPRIRFSTFAEMWLPIPPREEQLAIAAHVIHNRQRYDSHLHTLRASIATLREYRTALISAAVTGKINVSEEAVATAEPNVAPEKPAAKPNPYFRRTVFAAEIIDRLCDEPTFGHVKFQKCLFVAQHHLGIGDFEENYKRMAAGPYDNRLVRSVDSQLEKGRWFKAEKIGDRYAYRRLDKAGGHRKYFDSYFGDHADQLAKLLDLFRPLDTDRAEIVATLYAVWNDFLLRGEACDDDKIVAEVLTNWHDRKKRFDDAIWRRALNWMRDKGLVPSGFGKPTVPGDGKDG